MFRLLYAPNDNNLLQGCYRMESFSDEVLEDLMVLPVIRKLALAFMSQ